MVTNNVAVSAEGGGSVPNGIQGSSQDLGFPRSEVFGQHGANWQNPGPRGRRSSPTGLGRRHHRHHHHYHHLHHLHHLKGPYGVAHGHGHGDLFHGGRKHHGGAYHGLKARHASRGLQEVGGLGQGPRCRRRRHRSLSPHHLMHSGAGDGALGSPLRGHRGPGGRGPCDGGLLVFSVREHHLQFRGQEPNSAAESERSPPLPAAIEQGIEQLGQLSLRSEPGSL